MSFEVMNVIKVFMEYRIKADQIVAYQSIMEQVRQWMARQNAMNYEHLEGVDQSGLFVEMFDVKNMDEYYRLKKLRCEESPFFAECVVGGKDRIHMWAFKETSDVKRI